MMLEKDVEAALVRIVEKHGGLCLKWVCPGWAGVPDRIIIMPGGAVHFAELKRPKGGRTSRLQEWWHKRLRGLGFWVWVPKDTADLKTIDFLLTDQEPPK